MLKMKKLQKEEKGITLIALVITIIVLLILAGVTIATLTGDNGILTRANDAKEKTEEAEQKEKEDLDSTEDLISQYVGIDWDSVLENATKHPDQITSTAIGVGTDGKPVNMDLWEYTLLEDGTYALNTKDTIDGKTKTSGYLGKVIDGKIVGCVPQYIKGQNDTEFKKVTSLYRTFQGGLSNNEDLINLIESPIIPKEITNLDATFAGLSNLNCTIDIPKKVESMFYTFSECKSLKKMPTIPNSVKNLEGTFYKCESLTQAGYIPDSVTTMSHTFYLCTGLERNN